MRATWTVIRSGRAQTFEAAGIRQCQLTRTSDGAESMSITVAADAPPFFRDEIVTFRRNAKNWFHGRVVTARRDYAARSAEMTVELVGPWTEFADRTFVCVWKNGGSEELVSRGFVGLGGSSGTGGDAMNVGAWIRELATRVQQIAAQQYGGREAFWIGTISCPVSVPPQKLADGSFEEALQKITEFVPNLVVSWNHLGSVATLNIQRAGELLPLTLALGNTALAGVRGGITEFTPQRSRMTPQGVCICLRKQTEKEREDGSKFYSTTWRKLVYPLGVGPGWRNVLTFAEDEPRDSAATRWEFPADLARNYFEHLSAVGWQGSVTWKGEDVLDELTPGRVLNVTGGHEDFETMRAVIFSVKHDVMTGLSTAEYGPPHSLGFDSFRQWMAWQRRRKLGIDVDEHHVDEMTDGESDEETYGFGDKERKANADGAAREIQWCDDGNGPMTGEFRVRNARQV